jgi:hypothetical protein
MFRGQLSVRDLDFANTVAAGIFQQDPPCFRLGIPVDAAYGNYVINRRFPVSIAHCAQRIVRGQIFLRHHGSRPEKQTNKQLPHAQN